MLRSCPSDLAHTDTLTLDSRLFIALALSCLTHTTVHRTHTHLVSLPRVKESAAHRSLRGLAACLAPHKMVATDPQMHARERRIERARASPVACDEYPNHPQEERTQHRSDRRGRRPPRSVASHGAQMPHNNSPLPARAGPKAVGIRRATGPHRIKCTRRLLHMDHDCHTGPNRLAGWKQARALPLLRRRPPPLSSHFALASLAAASRLRSWVGCHQALARWPAGVVSRPLSCRSLRATHRPT